MGTRLELQSSLEEILGSRNVYFQPPSNISLKYPCIKYHLTDIFTNDADNIKYFKKRRYILTLIHKDPDNEIVDKLIDFGCAFDRFYAADNLNHYVFMIYY